MRTTTHVSPERLELSTGWEQRLSGAACWLTHHARVPRLRSGGVTRGKCEWTRGIALVVTTSRRRLPNLTN